MHIVFLVHRFPVEGISTGGAGNYVANMAQTMSNFGHKVTVITEADEKNTFIWKGVEVRKIRATARFKDNGRPMKTYKKVLKNLARSVAYNREAYLLNKIQPIDIIQSVSSYGIPFFRLKKIPYIIRVSEYPPLWSGAVRENFDFDSCVTAKRLDESISFKAMQRVDQVLMPSFLMQKLIYERTGKMGKVIESPVVLGDIDKLRLAGEEFQTGEYLVTHGALTYRKSVHVMRDVIKAFLMKYPDKKFVMIGRDKELKVGNQFIWVSDYLRGELGENASRLVFMGELQDRQRLFSIIKNSYACVLPTRIDNLPNSVLEAMALGKIVISTTSERGTSVEQLITDGENGYLAQVDDLEGLLQKIDIVMSLSEEKRNEIELKALERMKELTPEKVYYKMMDVYEELINRREV